MKDNFPTGFYQETLEPEIVRTSDPNGGVLLDPLDLLGSTPWAVVNTRFSLEDSRKKRNLIFADPAYKSCSKKRKDAICSKLREAKRSGFKIYILENEQLKEWDDNDIPKDYEVDLEKASIENINRLAWEQHKLSANNICVLDYFTTNALTQLTGGLMTSDFITDPKETSTLDEFLTYLSKDNRNQKKLKEIAFDAGNFLELSETFKAKKLNFIEKVQIIGFVDEKDFKKFCEIFQKLKKLDLSGCSNISECFKGVSENQLASLEEIVLANTGVNAEDVKQLFKAAPNLKEINLTECTNIFGCFEGVSENHLRHLEGIDLNSTDVNAEDLKQLFKTTPNLKNIGLNACSNISRCFEGVSKNSLRYLEKISLNRTNVNAEDLKNLIKATPNLKNIDLSDCSYISGCFEGVSENPLRYLEGIDLNSTDVNAEDLKQLFKTTPNLKEIDLMSCSNISGCFKEVSENPLRYLEIIDLSSTDVNTEDLKQLIKAVPNLKITYWSGCKNISGCFEGVSENPLRYLEVIDLNSTDVNAEDLKQLFKTTPNLKEINLNKCSNISGCFEGVSENPLRYLEKISLKVTDVNAEDLKQLIKAAPNLKTTYRSDDDVGSVSDTATNPVASKALLSMHKKLQEKTSLDFSSSLNDKSTSSYVKYFSGVSPSLYRLYVWEPDLDSTDLTRKYITPTDFKPVPDNANPLQNTISYSREQYRHEPGTITVEETAGNSIILPSLDAEEKIASISIVDAKGNIIDKNIKLEYSEDSRFYRVELPKPGKYTIHFELAMPNKTPKLPDKLDSLVNHYNKEFKPNDLLIPQFNTLGEAAKFYRDNKTGRCELRALAAYHELLELGYHKKDMRIITNDLHAYLEVKIGGVWNKLDLGGYPSTLNEQSMPVYKQKSTLDAKEEPLVEIPEINFETTGLEANETGRCLYLIPTISALNSLYAKCVDTYQSENVFVVNEIAKVNLTGNGINQQGKILPNYTHLQRWLNNHPEQKRVIVVDMRALKDDEMPQLNDLLDRKIEGQTLPENVEILLVDTPERGYYGPDFRRRVPLRMTVNASEKPLLLSVPPEFSHEKTKTTRIEIDLFNSPFYERMLLGCWQLQRDDQNTESIALKLVWKKSELFKAIEDANGAPIEIVFKNPPLDNPQFRTFLTELQTLRRLPWADQTLLVPQNISFYQSSGYDWSGLVKNAEIEQLNEQYTSELYCLSNANILSFINDPAYFFSKETQMLEPQDSYLTRVLKNAEINQRIRIVCAPGLSESTLAQFLTEANKRGIAVSFMTPDLHHLPVQSVLHDLPMTRQAVDLPVVSASNVVWELHSDVYSKTQQMKKALGLTGTFLNMSSLSAADLGHFPLFSKEDIDAFLKTSTLSFKAPLSDIAEKLKKGETVVLTGDIPPVLYEALTSLSLGYIDGIRFSGKLIILTTPKEQTLVEDITGQKLTITKASPEEKQEYIHETYGEILSLDEAANHDLATLEQTVFKQKMGPHEPFSKSNVDSDEERSQEIDERRLTTVKKALALSPWAMIEGKTGIGKSHFMQNVLTGEFTVCHSLEEWLAKKPGVDNKPMVLVVDEANFNSQLNNMGDNFLERFNSLQSDPPGFLWQGKYHTLTSQHKVVFAFNPSTYGQGRQSGGILSEHNVPVRFNPLPDFYLRARVIEPLLRTTEVFNDMTPEDKEKLSGPIVYLYRWLTENSKDEVFITPREIKAMINLIAVRVNQGKVTDSEILMRIAAEVAYDIGRQTIIDDQALLKTFDQAFPVPQRVMGRTLPENSRYQPYQEKAYHFIQDMLDAKEHGLGLGGVILEGPSNIGKTFFINEIIEEYKKKTNKKVYSISPSTPYMEKVKILRQAFEEGALVIAEEFNTGLWPNKLLNNYLMGLDEDGKPSSKPGFMLIGTQNPPSFVGRSEEDPAIRRRVVKLSLDWPRIDLHIVQNKTTPTPPSSGFMPSYSSRIVEKRKSESTPSSNTKVRPGFGSKSESERE